MKWLLTLVWLSSACSLISSSKIPLTKCCSDDEMYHLGDNKCVNGSITGDNWVPPISYLVRPRNKNAHQIDDFNMTRNLIQCPDGSIVQSTTDFLFYGDGTLRGRTVPSTLTPGTFCIDGASADGRTFEGKRAARFCVADPCTEIACVKKCCPMGYSFEEKSCMPSADGFPLKFKNKERETLKLTANSFKIRSGVLPNCPEGITMLDPSDNPKDEFFISSSGQLFVPMFHTDPNVDEYCIEDLLVIDENDTEQYQRKALICLSASELDPDEQIVLNVLSYLLFIASIFLIVTFLVYLVIPELRNIHGVTVMCYCASLAATFITLGIIQLKNDFDKSSCIVLGIFTHFFFLSSFTWLNVLSFDIWWTLGDLRRPHHGTSRANRVKRRFIFYSLYAWGVPLIIVAIGQILNNAGGVPDGVLKPNFGELKCFFRGDDYAILCYLYGPIAVQLLSNVVFFTLTAVRLHVTQKDTARATRHKKKKENTVIIFSLFLLMGLTWISEIITWAVNAPIYYSIPTDILNILTGVFIFVIFVCKKKVLRLLQKRFLPAHKSWNRGQQSTQSSNSRSTCRNKSTTGDITLSDMSTKDTSLQDVDLSK